MKKLLEYKFNFISALFFYAVVTACAAQPSSLKSALEVELKILQTSTRTQSAIVNFIDAEKAQVQLFLAKNTFAGYPATSDTKPVKQTTAKKLAAILLGPQNYSNIQLRCLNKQMMAIRFIKNNNKVEVVIGTPCNQVIFALKNEHGIQQWSGVLRNTAGIRIYKLLK